MFLKFQKYELTIKYTRGKDMRVADALPRTFRDESSDETELHPY